MISMLLSLALLGPPLLEIPKPAEKPSLPKTIKPLPDLSGAKPGIRISETSKKSPSSFPKLQKSLQEARILIEKRIREINKEVEAVKREYNIVEQTAEWPDETRKKINEINDRRTRLTRERQLLALYEGRRELYELMKESKELTIRELETMKAVFESRRVAFLNAATTLRALTQPGNKLSDIEQIEMLNDTKTRISSLLTSEENENYFNTLISDALKGNGRAMIDLRTFLIDQSAREQGRVEGIEIILAASSRSINTLIAEDERRIRDRRNTVLNEVLQ